VTGNELIELLMVLRRDRGATMVIVTHDPDLAARADRHVQLIDGRIASMG
jgi:putative ABC transport system ATP-binding protein